MDKPQKVFAEVAKHYSNSTTSMGKWMWHNHTQNVADNTVDLAKKYGADPEIAYCAALLHDLGDSEYERGHPDFDTWAMNTSSQILKKADFSKEEAGEIIEAIRTHSCHNGNLPTTLEGKILATADAMWHYQTSFFAEICYMNKPNSANNYKKWQEWFNEKIERDYHVKIFFEDERNEVKSDYLALKLVFNKPSLGLEV